MTPHRPQFDVKTAGSHIESHGHTLVEDSAKWKLRRFGVPIMPKPEPGEAVQSFLMRTSEANNLSLMDTAKGLGLVGSSKNGKTATWQSSWFIRPSTELAKLLGDRQMFLSHFATKCFRLMDRDRIMLNELARREWLRVSGTLLCPQCLRVGRAYWRTCWRLGPIFVCTEHGCLLSAKCPICKAPHGGSKFDGQTVPAHKTRVGSVTRCMNPAKVGSERAIAKLPCGADLTEIPVVTVPDEVVEIQLKLAGLLSNPSAFRLREEFITPLEFFDDFRLLTSWVLLAGGQDLADGLGVEIESDWRKYCHARDTGRAERIGKKGSNDHPYSTVPPPSILAVGARHVTPILLATEKEAFWAGLSWLCEIVERRAREALQRARGHARISPLLLLGLAEVTIKEKNIKAYLANHPVRGRWSKWHHCDRRITVEFVRERLPEICRGRNPSWILPPLRVMVRFFNSRQATVWADVFRDDDPPTIGSMVTRLVNEAGRAGVSRRLARLVVEFVCYERGYNTVPLHDEWLRAPLARKTSS